METRDSSVTAQEASSLRISADDEEYQGSLYSTESLRSSVFAYEQENGRTYHTYQWTNYQFPCDDQEQERLDLHYHALRLSIQDKLFHAPLAEPIESVLDVGAGTGIWCLDLADSNPDTKVYGFDLTPMQPIEVPLNLRFEVMDVQDSWEYGEQRFDLVHTRIMNGFIIKDWSHVCKEAFDCLKDGGWMECQETDCHASCDDGTIPADSKVTQWGQLWQEGMEKIGMTGKCDPDAIVRDMKGAGFINCKVLKFKMPMGPWPRDPMLKQAGAFCLVGFLNGLHGISARVFTQALGWKIEELEVLLAQVRREMKNASIHSYCNVYVIMGQKPKRSQVYSLLNT